MKILKGICFILFCCWANAVQAQYYYQDIYNTQLINKEHAFYISTHVQQVNIVSYDVYHSVNKDFTCSKVLSDDNKRVITRTGSATTGNSVLTSIFNDSGCIEQTVDSSSGSANHTFYYYNATVPQQLDSLVLTSLAIKAKDTFLFKESHIYQYDPKGILKKMIRKKNGQEYSQVTFTTDSSGNIFKEVEKGINVSPPPVYYKYNSEGKITDIFHYNTQTGKMEPDFLFDYDTTGRLSEKTTVAMNTRDYLLWVYTYNEKGLIRKEECYGKKHTLQGSLEYEYTY